MIVVMQCAGTKQPGAGSLQTKDGSRVCFVANPGQAPSDNIVYARPDDPSDIGPTWRDMLLQYNLRNEGNPLQLARAFELYSNSVYRRLADKVGVENLYILSAGWGLIAATFLTPVYDITFTAKADAYKRRKKSHSYRDLCMLPQDTTDPIVFFGSKDYAPLFGH